MNDYEKQAVDFCDKTGTRIYASFIRNGKYFDDDKDNRDIYQIVLARNNQVYAFTFGASITNSSFVLPESVMGGFFPGYDLVSAYCKKKGIDMNRCKSKKGHRTRKVSGVPPSAYDILACLEKGGAMSFEDFCADYGYSTDSIKDKATWEKVLDEAINVDRMFSDIINELQKIA